MQFERAEFTSPNNTIAGCAACKQPLTRSYFQAAGRAICERCAAMVRNSTKVTLSGFLKACVFGFGACLLGAAVEWAALKFFNVQAALITIGIGFAVGKMVRKGSGGAGGLPYQLLAVFLTYTSMVIALVPMELEAVHNAALHRRAALATSARVDSTKTAATELEDKSSQAASDAAPGDTASPASTSAEAETSLASKPRTQAKVYTPVQLVAAFASLVGLVYLAPVASGFSDILNLLIIGFGLYQAWKMTRPLTAAISGPFLLESRTANTGA